MKAKRITWTAEDIQAIHPVPLKQAQAILDDIWPTAEDIMVEHGWDVLREAIRWRHDNTERLKTL